MKSLTFFSNKIIITLYDNVFTIYDKTPVINFTTELSNFFINESVNDALKKLGFIDYVTGDYDDPNHGLYHQDDLSKSYNHWHLKFPRITTDIVWEVGKIFADHSLLKKSDLPNLLKLYNDVYPINYCLPQKKDILKNGRGKPYDAREDKTRIEKKYKYKTPKKTHLFFDNIETLISNINADNTSQNHKTPY